MLNSTQFNGSNFTSFLSTFIPIQFIFIFSASCYFLSIKICFSLLRSRKEQTLEIVVLYYFALLKKPLHYINFSFFLVILFLFCSQLLLKSIYSFSQSVEKTVSFCVRISIGDKRTRFNRIHSLYYRNEYFYYPEFRVMKMAFSSKSKWKWEKRTLRPTTNVQDIFNLQDCQCAHLDEITLREERKNATAQNRRKNNKNNPQRDHQKQYPRKCHLRIFWDNFEKQFLWVFTNILLYTVWIQWFLWFRRLLSIS